MVAVEAESVISGGADLLRLSPDLKAARRVLAVARTAPARIRPACGGAVGEEPQHVRGASDQLREDEYP
jgi:hypothetical protein